MTIRSFCRIAIEVGAKIWFVGERGGYTVRAMGKRYLVCTKPFNLPVAAHQQPILYTVVDMQCGHRGTEDLVFGLGCFTDEECDAMLQRLERGESGVSRRNCAIVHIESIEHCPSVNKQLLTDAAKFVGLEGSCENSTALRYLDEKGKAKYWNPLTDSSEAMRILASHRLSISYGVSRGFQTVFVRMLQGGWVTEEFSDWVLELGLLCPSEEYRAEATRRAVVMLVAEMQRAKDQQNS